MKYAYTTQKQIRTEFWQSGQANFIQRRGWKQNDYPADVRMSFIQFVDVLEKDGDISEALAQRVTL